MPLTDDQKARIEELSGKEMLTTAEADELAQLENIPETEEEESFDDAWDELEDGKSPSEFDDDDDDDAGEGDDSTPGAESDNSDSGTGQTPDERDEEIAAMKQRMSSWEGRLKAADKRAADAEAKLKAMEESKAKAESDNDASLEDDDPELSEFFDEFPDLKGPISKVAEKIATKIVKSKLGDVDEIRSEVTAVKDTIREDSDQKHVNDITEAHPDWKQIYESGKLEAWIKEQARNLILKPLLFLMKRRSVLKQASRYHPQRVAQRNRRLSLIRMTLTALGNTSRRRIRKGSNNFL
jgi:hypothetical protein